MESIVSNLMDEEIELVPSSPDSDAEQILSMEEEALKIADYISKRRAKMKPSLRSLTNLGHAGILKSSSSNLKSLSETPEQSPGMEEEVEDDSVPTADLLNLSPVRNKPRQHRRTIVSRELQDMFGFEETPLPKPKSRQRRVTLKTPSEDEPGDKENDKPSTSAASFTDTCVVTRTKQPAIQQEEPVFEIAKSPVRMNIDNQAINTQEGKESKMLTRSRSKITNELGSASKVKKSNVKEASHHQTKNVMGPASSASKMKSSYCKPTNVKSRIDTGRTPAKSVTLEPTLSAAQSNRRLSLRISKSNVPQTPDNKLNALSSNRPSTAKKTVTSRIDTGLSSKKSIHSNVPPVNRQFATPVQALNAAPKRPSSATVGQIGTPQSAVPKRLQLARLSNSVQPKRTLPSRAGNSQGITRIEEASPPVEGGETPRPIVIRKPLYGTAANTKTTTAGRRSLTMPAGTKTTRLRAK